MLKEIQYILKHCNKCKKHTFGNYICRFSGSEIGKKIGYSKQILTCYSKEFVLKDTWAYLLDKIILLITTTPYHPLANKSVKRLDGVLLLALGFLSSEDPLSWPKFLSTAILMARSIVNYKIQLSPF